MPVTKIIVTNYKVMTDKYPSFYTGSILPAINELINADSARGITTTLVYLDNATQMQTYHATPVTIATDDQQNKVAIDGVYAWAQPNYLVILGSNDVVSQQMLQNPMQGTPDPIVPSDLPYASTAPYSTDPKTFYNLMNRIIGRIPDTPTNGHRSDDGNSFFNTITHTTAQLSLAPVAPSTYLSSYFALSSAELEDITDKAVTQLFGANATAVLSPPNGPEWSAAQYRALSHYISCHGSSMNPNWYGYSTDVPPVISTAMESSDLMLLAGGLTPGTLVSATPCYGAQLYVRPSNQTGGICLAYLTQGAGAFFGSTTTSYGDTSASALDYCDYITYLFLYRMFTKGESTGVAYYNARRLYMIAAINHILPHLVLNAQDWLTFTQFNMYGDPSLTPINITQLQLEQQAKLMQRPLETVVEDYHRELQVRASQMPKLPSVSTPSTDVSPSAETAQAFNRLAQQANFVSPTVTSYVADPDAPDPREYYGEDVTIHIMSDTAPNGARTSYIATEVGGRLVHIQEVQAR